MISSFGDISINISASSVAWYGAILASLTALKTIVDLLNDRRRIKIEWQFNMKMTDTNDTFFVVTVINKGRRPSKITHVATKSYGQKEIALLTDSFYHQEKRILTEQQPSTMYRVKQGNLSSEILWYVSVTDATGKEYRRYNPETTTLIKRMFWYCFKPKNNAKFTRK